MRKRQVLAQLFRSLGGAALLDRYWGKQRITVLAYHRIADVSLPEFVGFQPNVSATPQMFDRQMAYVRQHFSVIDVAALEAFIEKGTALPPRPLLITFDDGYYDNYAAAYPILRKYDLPAVIFLATSRMEDPSALWWDRCAEYFRRTMLSAADLPIIGQQAFTTPAEKEAAGDRFIAAIKALPDEQKQQAVADLRVALGVDELDVRLFMNWDQVRELVANRVACLPHTVTHPILTRIPEQAMREQIFASRDAVVQQTGQQVATFAYTNGMPGDYNAATFRALRDAGFKAAVTLSPGPVRPETARRYPYQIPRIFLSHRDTFEIFLMKVMGVPALTERPQLIEERS
jgi:peptidoglycan/xylan/chitin deacetylase (PgdA/CDA1 family)